MDTALQTFTAILRKHGDNVTAARKQVFLAMHDKGPQSMHELSTSLMGVIDRTSIYRAIELFERLGIVHRIQIGWKYKVELSDVFVDHHHHITCLGCKRVIAVREDQRIEQLIAEIAATNHISAPIHQLEIQGYCERCSATR